jgi:hypothetical protein
MVDHCTFRARRHLISTAGGDGIECGNLQTWKETTNNQLLLAEAVTPQGSQASEVTDCPDAKMMTSEDADSLRRATSRIVRDHGNTPIRHGVIGHGVRWFKEDSGSCLLELPRALSYGTEAVDGPTVVHHFCAPLPSQRLGPLEFDSHVYCEDEGEQIKNQ